MILRKKIPFILGLCLCTLLSAQTSIVDSLQRVLSTFSGNNLDKGNLFIDLSNAYYQNGDSVQMKAYIMEAINLAQKSGLKHVEKRAYTSLGNFYFSTGQYYLAFTNYKKSEKLCIELNDGEYLERIYYNMMRVFDSHEIRDRQNIDYYADKFLETAAERYDLNTLQPYDTLRMSPYNPMPLWIFFAQYLKGSKLTLSVSENINLQESLEFCLNMLQKLESMPQLLGMKITLLLDCAYIYRLMNSPQDALHYMNTVRKLYKTDINSEYANTMPIFYALFAETFAMLQQPDSAIYYLKKSQEVISTDLNWSMSYYNKLFYYSACIATEKAKGNYSNALKINIEFFHFTDSIEKIRKSAEIARLNNWNELELLDNKLEILNHEKQKQKKLILILTISLILIFVLLALLILLYRKTSEKNIELKKLHSVKDKLFSVISHDLRSPMASLTSVLRIANKKRLDPEMQRQFFKDISSRVDDTFSLLDNLLRWSKSQMQRIVPSPVCFNVRVEIEKIMEVVKNIAQSKKINLTNLCEDHNIFADKDMFAVVVRNLTINAIKYSYDEGEVKITSQVANDNKMIISVIDAGIGMSQEVQNNLFNLSQSKSLKGTNNETGTGLGLVLCADLVKMNGGNIWFTSKEGNGSTFSFTLPLKIENN
ncbi:MAG: HAMP domain-containing histidine kinase [Marinilabiliaceae bacterium]|nr:HAMP domain-containing histidine kinase [Marinilabiliaceae bacterium]